MKRRTARQKAFQILFQLDINNNEPMEAIRSFLEIEENDAFLQTVVEGVTNKKSEIDATIADHLENWSIKRIAAVERTVLRIATYEMDFLEDIPKNVSINEAVELGKIFGDEQSGKFINGVLSKY